jgi:hypothetical protein
MIHPESRFLKRRKQAPIRPAFQVLCPICGGSVSLESAKTDEQGKTIHEDCYLFKVKLTSASRVDNGRG